MTFPNGELFISPGLCLPSGACWIWKFAEPFNRQLIDLAVFVSTRPQQISKNFRVLGLFFKENSWLVHLVCLPVECNWPIVSYGCEIATKEAPFGNVFDNITNVRLSVPLECVVKLFKSQRIDCWLLDHKREEKKNVCLRVARGWTNFRWDIKSGVDLQFFFVHFSSPMMKSEMQRQSGAINSRKFSSRIDFLC